MNGIKCHLSRDEFRKILSEAIIKRLKSARRLGAPKIIARNLGGTMAKRLPAGSEHYTAYVGPPGQYDFMGATQFRLLCTLGLREHHRLLDFGCGSLRAGRLFIPYLNPGHYYGVEPNQWLVEDAVKQEIGADIIQIKKPTFLYHDTFTCREFNVSFSYILAQSIFSHAGVDIVHRCFEEFAACLDPKGIAAVTFIHAEAGEGDFDGTGWVYPDCVSYSPDTIQNLLRDAGLVGCEIPWYHPRQNWYVLSKSPARLPGSDEARYLTGAVLFDPEFADSAQSS